MLRVLILATRVPVKSGDGTPSFVLDNAAALARDFDVTILAPRVRGSQPVSQHDGVTVKRFPYFPARWERLAEDAMMPQLAKHRILWLQAPALVLMMLWHTVKEHLRIAVDVVHAQWIIPAGFAAFVMKMVFRTPYLVTSRGADAFQLDSWPLRALKRTIINRSSRFIGVSQDIVDQFPKVRCPTHVQPSGIDFAYWETAVGVRTPVPRRVLFVGRLAAKKGVEDAVRAVMQLDGFELRVVGDGPLEPELRALAATSRSGDRIVFLGRRRRAEIVEEMRSAACIVIPSVTAENGDRDGTPNVLGEAIASGVPVIASRIAGLAEFVIDGQTGRLHEPGDVTGLIAALREVATSPELALTLPRDARSRFGEVFDLSRVALLHGGWYREAAAGKRGHTAGSSTGAPD